VFEYHLWKLYGLFNDVSDLCFAGEGDPVHIKKTPVRKNGNLLTEIFRVGGRASFAGRRTGRNQHGEREKCQAYKGNLFHAFFLNKRLGGILCQIKDNLSGGNVALGNAAFC
jgi:hypothetical protein